MRRSAGLLCLLTCQTCLSAAEVTLEGTIQSAPPGAGYVVLGVHRIAGERGRERRFRQSLPARLLLSRSGERPPVVDEHGNPLDAGTLSSGQSLTCWVGPSKSVSLVAVGPPEQAVATRRSWSRRANYNRWKYSTEMSRAAVKVPMVFPVLGRVNWRQGYLAELMGQPHSGVDLSAPKLRGLIACWDGYAVVLPDTTDHPVNTVVLVGDGDYTAIYTHLNDDAPGTNDGQGRYDQAFAPGLRTEARVKAGQLLGYLGDSGVATNPHLHFELRERASGVAHDPASSLQAAQVLTAPRVPRWLPELRPGPGEVRLDGFLRQVDPKRPALFLDLVARSTSQGTTAATRPETAGVLLRRGAQPSVSGASHLSTPLEPLPLGLGVTVLAKPSGQSLVAREVYLDCGGLEPERQLAGELERLGRAVAD